jgi:hypothetical protein
MNPIAHGCAMSLISASLTLGLLGASAVRFRQSIEMWFDPREAGQTDQSSGDLEPSREH